MVDWTQEAEPWSQEAGRRAARAASRPGPHCYGGSADCAILANEKLTGTQRNNAYLVSYTKLYNMAHATGGLPIHEAIIEYDKDNVRITHIHVQVRRDSDPAKRFIARRWKINHLTGNQEEVYEDWKP